MSVTIETISNELLACTKAILLGSAEAVIEMVDGIVNAVKDTVQDATIIAAAHPNHPRMDTTGGVNAGLSLLHGYITEHPSIHSDAVDRMQQPSIPAKDLVYAVTDFVHDATIIAAAHYKHHSVDTTGGVSMGLNVLQDYIIEHPSLYSNAVSNMQKRLNTIKEMKNYVEEAPLDEKLKLFSKTATYILAPGCLAKSIKTLRHKSPFNMTKEPFLFKSVDTPFNIHPIVPEILSLDEIKRIDIGTVIYVINQKKELIISSLEVYTDRRFTHWYLAKGEPVYAAGEAQIIKQGGKFGKINNRTGTYCAQGEHLKALVETTFCNAGFDAWGTYVDFWKENRKVTSLWERAIYYKPDIIGEHNLLYYSPLALIGLPSSKHSIEESYVLQDAFVRNVTDPMSNNIRRTNLKIQEPGDLTMSVPSSEISVNKKNEVAELNQGKLLLTLPAVPLSIGGQALTTTPVPPPVQQIYASADTRIPLSYTESKTQVENQDTMKEFEHSSRLKCPSKKPITEEAGSLSCIIPHCRSDAHEFYPDTENHLKESERDELAYERCLEKVTGKDMSKEFEHSSRPKCLIHKTCTTDPQGPYANPLSDESDSLSCMVPYYRSDAHEFYPKTENHLKESERNELASQRCLQKTTAIANKKREEAERTLNMFDGLASRKEQVQAGFSVLKDHVSNELSETAEFLRRAGQAPVPPTAAEIRIAREISERSTLKNVITPSSVAGDIYTASNTYIPLSSADASSAPKVLGSRIGIDVPKRSRAAELVEAALNFVMPQAKAGELRPEDIPSTSIPASDAAKAAAQHIYSKADTHIAFKVPDLNTRSENQPTTNQEPRRSSNMNETSVGNRIKQRLIDEWYTNRREMQEIAQAGGFAVKRTDTLSRRQEEIEYFLPELRQATTHTKSQPSTSLTRSNPSTQPAETQLPSKQLQGLLNKQGITEDQMHIILKNSELMGVVKQLAHNEAERERLETARRNQQDLVDALRGGEQLFGVIGQIARKMECQPFVVASKIGQIAMMGTCGLAQLGYFSGTAAAGTAAASSAGFMACLGPTALLLGAAFGLMELFFFGDDGSAQEAQLARYNALSQQISDFRKEVHELCSYLAGCIQQVANGINHLARGQLELFKQQQATYELIHHCFKLMQTQLRNSTSETRHRLDRIEVNIQYLIKLTEDHELKRNRAEIKKTINAIKALNGLARTDANTSRLSELMSNLDTARQEMCEYDSNGIQGFADFKDRPLEASEFITRRIKSGDYVLGFLAEKFEVTTGLKLSDYKINKEQLFANHLWHMASSHYLQLLSLPSLKEYHCTDTLNSIEEQVNNATRFMNLIANNDLLFNKLLEAHERILHKVQFKICQYYTFAKSEKGTSDFFMPTIAMPISQYITGENLNSLKEVLYELNQNYLLLKVFSYVGGLSPERQQIISQLTHGDEILNQPFFPYEFPPSKKMLNDSVGAIQGGINAKKYNHCLAQRNLNLFDTGLNIIGAHKLTRKPLGSFIWQNPNKKTESIVHLNINACQDLRYDSCPVNLHVQVIPEDGEILYEHNNADIPLDFYKLEARNGYSLFSGIWASSHIHTGGWNKDEYLVLYTGSGKVAMRALNDLEENKRSAESRWLVCNNTGGPEPHTSIGVEFFGKGCSRNERLKPNYTPTHSSFTLKTQAHLIILDSDWSKTDKVHTQYHLFNLQDRRFVFPANARTKDWISKLQLHSPNHAFCAIYSQPKYDYSIPLHTSVSDEGVIIHGSVSAGKEMLIYMNKHLYKENDLPTKDMLSFEYLSTEQGRSIGVVDNYPIPSKSISQVKMTQLPNEYAYVLTVSHKVSETESRLACIVYPNYQFSKDRISTPSIPCSTHGEYQVHMLPPNIHPLPDCQAMRTLVVQMGGKDYLFITLLSKTYTILPFLFDPRTKELIQLAEGPTIHVSPEEYFDFEKTRREKELEGHFPWNNLGLNVKYEEDGMPVVYFSFTRIDNWEYGSVPHNSYNTYLHNISYKLGPVLKASFHILKPDYTRPLAYHQYTREPLWKPMVPAITNTAAKDVKTDIETTALTQMPKHTLGDALLSLKILIGYQRERQAELKTITEHQADPEQRQRTMPSIPHATQNSSVVTALQALEDIRTECNENYEFIGAFFEGFPTEPTERFEKMMAYFKQLLGHICQLNALNLNNSDLKSFLSILKLIQKEFSFISRSLKAQLKAAYNLGTDIDAMLHKMEGLTANVHVYSSSNTQQGPTFLPSASFPPSSRKPEPTQKKTPDNQSNAFIERLNPGYQYWEEDISSVLKQYKKLPYFQNATIIDVVSNLGENTITTRLSEEAQSNKTIFGILNIGNLHWTAFCILRMPGNKVMMLYKDSYGNPAPAALKVSLITIFGEKNIEIKFHKGAPEQTDTSSCGIFALLNLKIIAQALSMPDKNETIQNFESTTHVQFCTQEGANLLRRKQFAEIRVLVEYESVKSDKIYKFVKDTVSEHHHAEAKKIAEMLQAKEPYQNKIRALGPKDKFENCTIGVSIFVPRDLPEDPKQYRYQYKLCFNHLSPQEITTRLKNALGFHEDSKGLRPNESIPNSYVLVIDPEELTNITKRPPVALTPPEDSADFLPEIYANLQVSNNIEQQNAIKTILEKYLNPVDSLKTQGSKPMTKP